MKNHPLGGWMFIAIKNVDVLSNDAKNKKNNAGGDIISYRCNIWIKYK